MHSPDSFKYHQYAQRVRTVRFKDAPQTPSYHIGGAGYAWLGQQLRGEPLLPGLRNIHFQNCSGDSPHAELFPLMLSSTIERVEFGDSFLTVPFFYSYALPLICDGTSSLKCLVLHDESSGNGVAHNYWDILTKLAIRLQELAIRFPLSTALDTFTLQRLCTRLQNITSLTLDVHTPSHEPSSSALSEPILPVLQVLHIINRSGAKLCPCYPPVLLDKATSITFSLTQNITHSQEFKEALDGLSTNQSLRTVEINGRKQYVNSVTISLFLKRLPLEAFYFSLLALKQRPGSDPGHRILQSLVEAASKDPTKSRLQHLALPIWRETAGSGSIPSSETDREDGPEYSSLSCLLLVAQGVRGLQRLSLPIDSSRLGPNNETVASMIQNWKYPETPSELRYLEIAEMRNSKKSFTPKEYQSIARLLDMIFPNLISVTMVKDERLSNQWDEHWELIEEHRQMRKTIRLDRGYCW
ncbi:hypothetical protein H1R20_g15851, partial [Candolleomyces eurysporus]